MMSYANFKELSKDEKLTYLTKLRSENSIKDILEQWGITRPMYYTIAHEIGLPLNRKGNSSAKTAKNHNRGRRPKENNLPHVAEEINNEQKFTFSIDTSGPISLVSNILGVISGMEDRQVRVKMDVEVM